VVDSLKALDLNRPIREADIAYGRISNFLSCRLGIRRTVELTIDPAKADYAAVARFIEQSAGPFASRRGRRSYLTYLQSDAHAL
jgi:hypothetical protein